MTSDQYVSTVISVPLCPAKVKQVSLLCPCLIVMPQGNVKYNAVDCQLKLRKQCCFAQSL